MGKINGHAKFPFLTGKKASERPDTKFVLEK